jgi:hypothetical protein
MIYIWWIILVPFSLLATILSVVLSSAVWPASSSLYFRTAHRFKKFRGKRWLTQV